MTSGNGKARVGLILEAGNRFAPLPTPDVIKEFVIADLLERNRSAVETAGLNSTADMLKLYMALYTSSS